MGDYNGWKSYETWCVKLWIDNDREECDRWRTEAANAWEQAEHGGNEFVESRNDRARILLADLLHDYWDNDMHETQDVPELRGPYADLLNAALGEIDWREIAQALLDDRVESEAVHGD